ncbi:HAMP domain-containing histidine kinase [Rhizobium sp. CG5]|nr:HAMP domain-containing histidine kinase [Rhizobium sp. CG5]
MGDTPVARTAEIAILRSLFLAFLAPLIAAPLALSMILSPAVALPLGVSVVVAVLLISAVSALAVLRLRSPDGVSDMTDLSGPGLPLEACPGLVLLLDQNATLQSAGGRDAAHYIPYLREPLERAFAEQVHVTDRIAFVSAFDRLRQGDDAAMVELRLGRPVSGSDAGRFMNVRIDLSARRDGRGQFAGVVGVMRDITADVAARAELARMAGEVDQANDAKSRFLAAVSHEMRTPLNAILGFSDILVGEYFGRLENDRQREYVHLIRQSGGHLLSVVNAMLDMSKIEAGRYELMLEPFPVAEAINECESMLGLQAREKGLTLTSRLGRDLGEVTADQRALRQILINLVGNAIKFTEPGGAVTVDAVIEGGDLKLSISDTGIGIAPDKIKLLGQPFVQIQNDYNRCYEGSGLGLSLVKGLVALHGGRLTMTSRVGEGTVVSVTVPADGSGAGRDNGTEDGNMIEFPPRLKATVDRAERPQEERLYDDAKAKIA